MMAHLFLSTMFLTPRGPRIEKKIEKKIEKIKKKKTI